MARGPFSHTSAVACSSELVSQAQDRCDSPCSVAKVFPVLRVRRLNLCSGGVFSHRRLSCALCEHEHERQRWNEHELNTQASARVQRVQERKGEELPRAAAGEYTEDTSMQPDRLNLVLFFPFRLGSTWARSTTRTCISPTYKNEVSRFALPAHEGCQQPRSKFVLRQSL